MPTAKKPKTRKPVNTWGGPRPNSGRPRVGPYCPCGKMSRKRAKVRYHHCTRADKKKRKSGKRSSLKR